MGNLLWFSLFLTLLFFLSSSSALPFSLNSSSPPLLCNHNQSSALLSFKNSFRVRSVPSTKNSPYPNSFLKTDSWKKDTDCCRWDGVTCDIKTGNVIELHLSNSFLQGTITFNSSLFSLLHLQKLDLSCNNFNGSKILPQFGQFLNLTYLNLSSSKFLGRIPSEISHLSDLVSLDLSWNDNLKLEATTFKSLVQNLTQLKKLDLSLVDMFSVPPSTLMNLSSSFSSLKLEYCNLHGKFPNIIHLSKLLVLDLSGNNGLSLDPITFNKLAQNLTRLKKLDLSNVSMPLVEPSSLMNLSSSLSSLRLSFCSLQGKLPGSIIQRPNLQFLYLSYNENLTGSFPMSNWSCSLSHLSLSSTKIPVVLESNFFNNLQSVQKLELASCNFVGSNIALFGNLSKLTSLDLSLNHFNGEIPSSFANLKKLRVLLIRGSNISGRIPSYFTNFTQLSILRLSNNHLSGPIPSDIGKLSLLDFLDLSNNSLNGTIPSSLFTLPLRYLFLKNNSLTGPIPQFQNNTFRMIYLDLSHNKFYGSIPSTIFKQHLRVLILSSNNKLTGEISSAICELNCLLILDLSNNTFSGSIPQCLGSFSSRLTVLHLGMNNFNGVIPETFSKELSYLNFNGNKLQGRIPPSISNCKKLKILDLGKNEIKDTFPYFLANLPQLQILVLQSNKLHGYVKGFIANSSFSKLRVFDISDNMFNGPLPGGYLQNFKSMMRIDKHVGYMRDRYYFYDYSVTLTLKGLEIQLMKIQILLKTIDLSNNQFTGEIPQSIGNLKSIQQLNISHNYLTGNIESSLGNLSNLESLDLSSNLLSGRIPLKLTDLTFLAIFRVSNNQLEGPIPQGRQFNTFDSSSYEGNLGLCGFPLQKICENGENQQPKPLEEEDSETENGFGWKSVLAGYGFGIVFGLTIGYTVFRTKKPRWFVRMIEGEAHRKIKRVKKKARPNKNGRRRISCSQFGYLGA